MIKCAESSIKAAIGGQHGIFSKNKIYSTLILEVFCLKKKKNNSIPLEIL